MKTYTVQQIETEGKEATFYAYGQYRDGWIMPDGNGVDYAGFGQLFFPEDMISNIKYKIKETK